MSPPRFELTADEGGSVRELFEHFIASDGFASPFKAPGELETVSGVSAVPRGDRPSKARRNTTYQGEVATVDGVSAELFGKAFVGPSVLCDDEEPRCVFVDPVNDPRSRILAAGNLTVRQERGNEGTTPVPGGRMNHHPSRFVHDDQIVVLVDDSEGNIFRLDGERLGGRGGVVDALTVPESLARSPLLPIDESCAAVDGSLDLAPRWARSFGRFTCLEPGREEQIQALAILVGGDVVPLGHYQILHFTWPFDLTRMSTMARL